MIWQCNCADHIHCVGKYTCLSVDDERRSDYIEIMKCFRCGKIRYNHINLENLKGKTNGRSIDHQRLEN
jgi:hypothetical protein